MDEDGRPFDYQEQAARLLRRRQAALERRAEEIEEDRGSVPVDQRLAKVDADLAAVASEYVRLAELEVRHAELGIKMDALYQGTLHGRMIFLASVSAGEQQWVLAHLAAYRPELFDQVRADVEAKRMQDEAARQREEQS